MSDPRTWRCGDELPARLEAAAANLRAVVVRGDSVGEAEEIYKQLCALVSALERLT